MSWIDFDNSYFFWETYGGSIGKFKIESFLNYENKKWYLGSKVLACSVYGKQQLFYEPSYSFQPLFSDNEHVIFRFNENNTMRHSKNKNIEKFKRCEFQINYLNQSRSCDVINDINKNYFAKIEANDFEIQFPIKHLNVHSSNNEFQVETGIIAFPHKGNIYPSYIAFNRLNKFEISFASLNEGVFKEQIVNYNNNIYINQI